MNLNEFNAIDAKSHLPLGLASESLRVASDNAGDSGVVRAVCLGDMWEPAVEGVVYECGTRLVYVV
jgi:hypothetical protein